MTGKSPTPPARSPANQRKPRPKQPWVPGPRLDLEKLGKAVRQINEELAEPTHSALVESSNHVREEM